MAKKISARGQNFDQAWSAYQQAAREHQRSKTAWEERTREVRSLLSESDEQALKILEGDSGRVGVRDNTDGAAKGYDPYDSGRLTKTQKARRRDLARLSEWLTSKKKAKGAKKT